jgi:hypothetical protein
MWYLYIVELYSATKQNEILSFAGKWMELENIILSEVSSEGQKSRLPSYVGYRHTPNAAILWDTGHTKGRLGTSGMGKGRKPKTSMWLMCSLYWN